MVPLDMPPIANWDEWSSFPPSSSTLKFSLKPALPKIQKKIYIRAKFEIELSKIRCQWAVFKSKLYF
jgi:hypothetical protein